MIGIYKIENKVNNKKYIGQSVNMEDRWKHHLSELRNNRHGNNHLQYSFNKYGEENFEFSVITECPQEELDTQEIYWIDYYDAYDNDYGYNATLGGGGTRKRHPVLQFDLSGNFIREWDNGIIAGNETGVNIGTIYGCCIKKLKRGGRVIWMYKEEYIGPESLSWYLTDQKMQNIIQYDLYGNVLKIWDSPSDIVSALGINPLYSLLGDENVCHGYIFKYALDPTVLDEDYFARAREPYLRLKRKSFYQVDSDWNIVTHFDSLRSVVPAGFSSRLVRECLDGMRGSHKGFYWVYDNDIDKINSEEFRESKNFSLGCQSYAVRQYDLEHNFIKEYEYLSCVENDGFNKTNVGMCCNGFQNTYKGYIWEKGEYKERSTAKPVVEIDVATGECIGRFSSIKDASIKTGIHKACITGVCHHRQKTTAGRIFMFEDEYLTNQDKKEG